jgi:elongation factor Ts
MSATLEQIKELRNRTGAGVNAVKEAIEASAGDTEKAIQYLREKGLAKAAKRAGREAVNGVLGTYIHNDNRLVVTVEVAAETDFASRSADMLKFANEVALHIAANTVDFITVDSIPEDIVLRETEIFRSEVADKPTEVQDKIIAGKLDKFYKQGVLMNQQLFSDETKTVQDYMNELVAKLGEKIEITRFVKMKIAEPATAFGLN